MNYFEIFWLPVVVVSVGGYLLGSVSFSILFAKLFGKGDIRNMGSGNAGTTNVLRSVGKRAAALTFVFDALKCVAAVLPARFWFGYLCGGNSLPGWIAQYGVYLAGVCCMIGHIYPVYFKFRGGKGVVTLAATAALVDWRVFLICLGVFLIVFLCSRMVSLCSIVGSCCYPAITFCMTFFVDYRMGMMETGVSLTYVITATIITAVAGGIIVIKHRGNIKRIAQGTEKRISFHKKKEPVS